MAVVRHPPAEVHANTDIGQSAQGISVGINSLVMGASIRAMVGLGGFGFSTGVYDGLRFSGTVLRGPDIAFACRQGTIESYIDSGIGYSVAKWVSSAINFFLVIRGPSIRIFNGNTQIPANCATPKGGGGTAWLLPERYRTEPWWGLPEVSFYG